MNSIAIITSQAFSLWNFRGPLIRTLTARGIFVYALAPDYDDEIRERVRKMGAVPVDFSLSRAGINPLKDVLTIIQLYKILKQLSPKIVFVYFVKPVLYGTLAACFANVKARFAMIEGLGYVFLDCAASITWQRRILRYAVSSFYKFALRLNQKVIFLNQVDVDQFVNEGIVSSNKVVQINGIGLDLDYFSPVPAITDPVTFILVARMLKEKGVFDFVEAARLVRESYADAKFVIVGGVDQNPGSIKESQLHAWVAEGILEWPGHVNDVRPWLAKSSVFVLPSYYREGLPRGNQEAMAMGRPIITTDWVGCRETVKDGVNGILIPIRDPRAIAQAMVRFIENPQLIEKMGLEGRRMAEECFDVHVINKQIMETMGLCLFT